MWVSLILTVTVTVTVILTLLMTLVVKVKGGWLQEDSTLSNVFHGSLCVEGPLVKATCGWRIVVRSDPALDTMTTYDGIVNKTEGGRTFLVDNASWNAADPDVSSHYCLAVEITGSFGNVMPDYVTVDWDCICVNSTCDPLPVQTSSSDVTSTVSVITSSESSIPGQHTITSLYKRHAGKCHVNATLTNQETRYQRCFLRCLRHTGCHGINVVHNVTEILCSYVMEELDATRLDDISWTSCNFWERMY